MRPRSVPQKQSGFSLRPMDIALIVMGVLIVGAIIAGGLLTANTPNQGTSGSASGSAGQPAPDFSHPASDGKTYTLSQFVGKPVVIEFFAPWCPHCQEDVPMFNELYDAYNSKGVEFVAVSATPFGRNYQKGDESPITMEDVAWFKDTFQVKFPMLFDGELKSATDYNIEYYPTVYVINSDGTIAEKLVGERDNLLTKERISASIDKALDK
jgi:peroxiredoxin